MPSNSGGSSRRIPWLLLLAALVVVPLLLTALAVFSGGGGIENRLSERSHEALTKAGLANVDVEFDGRDATISNADADQAKLATVIVTAIRGVRTVEVDDVKPVPKAPVPLAVAIAEDGVTLTGSVPDEAAKASLVEFANARGRPVVDNLTVDPNANLSGATVTLSGPAATADEKAAIGEQLRGALLEVTVDNQLVVPPAPPPPAFDRATLQQQLTGLLTEAPITFNADTSVLTAQGSATIARIADALRAAPQARIEVDGHVADTPGPDPNAQPLSDQRAGAVKQRLVELGIDAGRIDAFGFAATRPIAPNNTSAGQAANRRVEIIVL